MPKEVHFDYLFIGEELDTPPEERERVERMTRMVVALNSAQSRNGVSCESDVKRKTNSFVKSTRDVLKKVNGQPFDREGEVDEEDSDEEYLDDERRDLEFQELYAQKTSIPPVHRAEEIRRESTEVDDGIIFEPLPEAYS